MQSLNKPSTEKKIFIKLGAIAEKDVFYRESFSLLDTFVAEARFFELGHDAFLQFCRDEGFEREEPEPLPTNPVLRKVWQLVEMPQSSVAAKFFAISSMLVIVLSIIVFCLETLPQFQGPRIDDHDNDTLRDKIDYQVRFPSVKEYGPPKRL